MSSLAVIVHTVSKQIDRIRFTFYKDCTPHPSVVMVYVPLSVCKAVWGLEAEINHLVLNINIDSI